MDSPDSILSSSPEETFALGEKIGAGLVGGEVVLLTGSLGAGKTLLTKGILNAVDYDIDEVTSPSFALVNLYRAPRFDVYHIDLWRAGTGPSAAFAVGLDEILEDESAVVIIEWADHLLGYHFERPAISIAIAGDGEESRRIEIRCEMRNADCGMRIS